MSQDAQERARVNTLGYRTTYGYDLAGRQESVQNARGYRSTTVYDSAGINSREKLSH